jgi:carbohydrate kinase (thermoresistant glucokinase family)
VADPIVLIVMGVTGAGKSTIAERLAQRLGWAFQEGDALHPPSNVQKMSQGVPLTDEDRAPWLASIKRWIDNQLEQGQNGLVTCSALKRQYRDDLIAGRNQVRILYLRASEAVLRDHLAHRHGHFMPASMLDSQLATLEPPTPDENPIIVDIEDKIPCTVDDVITVLKSSNLALTA